MIKLIESRAYHLWTDALHRRALARQTSDNWDRGTYVRWTIISAWMTFESVCAEVLEEDGLGNRFKDKMDEAVSRNGLSQIDWSHGIWQKILKVYGVRKEFTHVRQSGDPARLITPIEDAEFAVATLREGIHAVCALAGIPDPIWAADDTDPGWIGRRMLGATMLLTHAGATDDPNAVRITFVSQEVENLSEVAPSGTPHGALLDALIPRLKVPVSAVRAYHGNVLVEEREFFARGS